METQQIPLTPFQPMQVPLQNIPLPRHWWKFAEARRETHPGLKGRPQPGDQVGPFEVVKASGDVTLYELPEELLGDVLRLDRSDPEAHVKFTRTFGPFTDPLYGLFPTFDDFHGWRRTLGVTLMLSPPDVEEPTPRFWFSVSAIKAMFALYTTLRDDRFSPRVLTRLWPVDPTWDSPMPTSRKEAEEEFLTRLGFALRTVDLVLAEDESGHIGPAIWFREDLSRRVELEIVNAYLADRPYRQCENETCGKWFSIQDTQPKYAHKVRQDMRFHHPSCRSQQHQREYRRRQAQKKKGGRR